MASDSSIPIGSPSSSFPCSNYQVFLSFRGRDVRHNFLDCFKDKLSDSGIDAFTDSEDIRASEPIKSMLRKIIQRAEVCIPIFSVNFPESKPCLMEVKWMVHFGKTIGKTILPIFYGIEPSDVRKQLDQNGEFFKKHIEDKVPIKKLKLWKSALVKATRRNGVVLLNIEKGYHGLIGKVIGRLRELLRTDTQDLPKHLVGIDHHVKDVLRKLDIKLTNGLVLDQELTGKRVVVIRGQTGIGKTTLAKAVYNKIRPLYRNRGCCFLPNVRCKVEEEKLVNLQKQLIKDLEGRTSLKIDNSVQGAKFIRYKFCCNGVFIVLDDADSDWRRIEELMGGLDWLSQGSKVLVTTNNGDIVQRFEGTDLVVVEHEVGELPFDKTRELFRLHAFPNNGSDLGEFADITDNITRLLKGNPRYIEIVGMRLSGKNINMWEEMEQMLKGELDESMENHMKLIYENLKTYTKGIFLDIACLFNGMDRRIPHYLWKAHDKLPSWGISELFDSSWLKLPGDELQMPELMVLLGKKIVMDEDRDNLLNRSRLWDHCGALRALAEIQERHRCDSGRAKVNALCLECDCPTACPFSCNKLRLLAALRVLRLRRVIPADPDEDLADPIKLHWLAWKGCAKASDLLGFCAANLLILDLSSTGPKKSTFALRGCEDYIQGAKQLKVLNLSGRSVESKIFPLPESLEHLILERCSIKISSISVLPKLLSLNIKQCKFIKEFPPVHNMEALKEILIDETGIEAITLPENLMKRLEVLSARKCIKLKQIPKFPDFCKMRVLYFEGCRDIERLPKSIEKLQQLEELDLSETMIKKLTPSFNRLGKLKILRMRRSYLEEFPSFIAGMQFLREIDFSCCGSMKGEYVIKSLSSLRILKLPSPEGSRLYMNRTDYCNLEIVEYDGELKISGIRRRNREEGEGEEEEEVQRRRR